MLPNLFIVGVGRSGTSLLQSMLGAHPRITFLPETQFVRRFILKPRLLMPKDYVGVERINRFGVSDNILQGNPLEVLNNICLAKMNNKDKYIGVKDPKLLEKINKLNKVFNSPSIIVMIRDPRAVVYSRTQATWSKSKPFYLHALLYSCQIGHYLKYNRDKAHEVFYEDLIKEPRKVLEIVNRFLKIEYSNTQLNFQGVSKELVSPEEVQWKKETFGPILANNSNKWQKFLSEKQISLVEYICKREMLVLGYHPTAEYNLTILDKVAIHIVRFIFVRLYQVRRLL